MLIDVRSNNSNVTFRAFWIWFLESIFFLSLERKIGPTCEWRNKKWQLTMLNNSQKLIFWLEKSTPNERLSVFDKLPSKQRAFEPFDLGNPFSSHFLIQHGALHNVIFPFISTLLASKFFLCNGKGKFFELSLSVWVRSLFSSFTRILPIFLLSFTLFSPRQLREFRRV